MKKKMNYDLSVNANAEAMFGDRPELMKKLQQMDSYTMTNEWVVYDSKLKRFLQYDASQTLIYRRHTLRLIIESKGNGEKVYHRLRKQKNHNAKEDARYVYKKFSDSKFWK